MVINMPELNTIVDIESILGTYPDKAIVVLEYMIHQTGRQIPAGIKEILALRKDIGTQDI